MGRSAATKAKRKGSTPVSQFVNERVPGDESAKPEPTYEELKAKLATLEKQNGEAKVLEFRVGNKGGVSVYGLGRFPVTLYYEQWIALLDAEKELRAYLVKAQRSGQLKMKGDKQ